MSFLLTHLSRIPTVVGIQVNKSCLDCGEKCQSEAWENKEQILVHREGVHLPAKVLNSFVMELKEWIYFCKWECEISERREKKPIEILCLVLYSLHYLWALQQREYNNSHLRTPLSQALRKVPAVKWWLAHASEPSWLEPGWSSAADSKIEMETFHGQNLSLPKRAPPEPPSPCEVHFLKAFVCLYHGCFVIHLR